MKKIKIISGDQRQYYAWAYLRKMDYDVELVSNFNLQDADVILASTPFLKFSEYVNCDFQSAFPVETLIRLLKNGQLMFAGAIPESISGQFAERGITAVDFLKDSEIVWQNAYLTAEALLGKIITQTAFSLRDAKIILLGFGRCGMNLAMLFKGFQSTVYVYDHHEANRSRASSFGFQALAPEQLSARLLEADLLINTVPQEILSPEQYEQFQKSCVLYDISSYPYGLNLDFAEANALSLYTCPGLPGKYNPKTAGEIIAIKVVSYLERM
ncbi:MAG: hypothetical protein K6G64_05185 [Eubacterium sp.]|nr:hypothetical protein [Eubacterium sp.]